MFNIGTIKIRDSLEVLDQDFRYILLHVQAQKYVNRENGKIDQVKCYLKPLWMNFYKLERECNFYSDEDEKRLGFEVDPFRQEEGVVLREHEVISEKQMTSKVVTRLEETDTIPEKFKNQTIKELI